MFGDKSQAPALEAYVKDFDLRVALQGGEILEAWTGTPRTPAPEPLPSARDNPGSGAAAAQQAAARDDGRPRQLRCRARRGLRAAHGAFASPAAPVKAITTA